MVGFSKATYMYWQKRFDRENPNKELEDKILEIHSDNKDFGYRRIHAMLRKQGYVVNKKRVQRIMQKLFLQVYHEKYEINRRGTCIHEGYEHAIVP